MTYERGASKIYPGQPPRHAYIYTTRELALKVAKTMAKHFSHEAEVVGSAVICTEQAYRDVINDTTAPEALAIAVRARYTVAADEIVEPGAGCPHCGERRADLLIIGEEAVGCQSCEREYEI